MTAVQPRPDVPLAISSVELDSVNRYRKLKDTSVLTIMFTDIKGFTRLTEEHGEQYSSLVREAHDRVLVPIIEENNGGLVVKHIGDAIMAVFSEPSTAVARALKIQDALRGFNAAHPELADIEVRIGLDMGQVAVENEINLDLFGRHVNRASRVEGLADGGQVFLTYSVFDSAKGWLASHGGPQAAWQQHGRYFLKGIPQAVEIYEVYDAARSKPRPPAKARKQRGGLPTLAVSAGLLVVGAGIALGVLQIQKTQVFFVNLRAEDVMLDGKTKILQEGEKSLETRRSLTPITAGRHVLHYDINYQVKYFTEIEVKRGKNYIEARFQECRTPSQDRHLTVYQENGYRGEEKVDETFDYFFYNAKGERVNHQANIQFSLSGAPDKPAGQILMTLAWKVTLDGKIISQEQKVVPQPFNFKDGSWNDASRQEATLTLYQDENHYYYARYYVIGPSANLDVGSAYIEYLDK